MVIGLAILIPLIFDTACLILIMHLTGRWFGIDFGPIKPGIAKVMAFLLVSSVLFYFLGGIALLINLVVWTVGFKIAFDLDWSELLIVIVAFAIGSFIVRLFVVTLILMLLAGHS